MVGLASSVGLGLTRNVVGGFRASASFSVADDFSTGVVGMIETSGAEGAVSLVGGAVTDQAGTNSGLFSITTGLEVTFNPQALGSGLTTDGDSTSTTLAIQLSDTVKTIDVTVRVTLTKPDDIPAVVGFSTLNLTLNIAMTPLDLRTGFSDADDVITATATGVPDGLSVASSMLSGTPTVEASGTSVTVTGTDASGQSVTTTLPINVIDQQPLKTVSVMNFLGNGGVTANSATHQDMVFAIPFTIGGTPVSSLLVSCSNWGITPNATEARFVPTEGYRIEEAHLTLESGETHQLTLGGATSWVVPAGANDIHTDEFSTQDAFGQADLQPGTKMSLKVRGTAVDGSNQIVDGGQVARTSAARFANPVALRAVRDQWTTAELQTYGGLVVPSGVGFQNGGESLPMILIGRHVTAFTNASFFAGDSITQGVGDDRIEYRSSYATRSMVDDVDNPTTWLPSINIGISGGVASSWAVDAPNDAHAHLTHFFRYVDNLVERYGVNSRSHPGHTNQRRVIWQAFKDANPAGTVYAVDVTGQTSSTDNFATVANQTLGSQTGVGLALDQMNAAAAADPLVDVFIETPSIRGSTDDTSEDYWRWAPNTTGDGLHPNATGHGGAGGDVNAVLNPPVPAAPDAFVVGEWGVTTGSGSGEIDIDITTLPDANNSPITALQYSTDAGASYAALTGTGTGSRTITALSAGGAIADAQVFTNQIMVRAVNAIDNGPDSDAKSVTAGTNVSTGVTVGTHTGVETDVGGEALFTFATAGPHSIEVLTGGNVWLLIVGGGAQGMSGGGAGGEVFESLSFAVSPGTYTIVIGEGGTELVDAEGSSVFGISTTPSGRGGADVNGSGEDGGCGGGQAASTNGVPNPGAATGSHNGFKGGEVGQTGGNFPSSGGGGAGGPGDDVSSGDTDGSNGGIGFESSITGTPERYGGAGSGNRFQGGASAALGGLGGGGDAGQPGTEGLGGGGGGGPGNGLGGNIGGKGGRGRVAIRALTP